MSARGSYRSKGSRSSSYTSKVKKITKRTPFMMFMLKRKVEIENQGILYTGNRTGSSIGNHAVTEWKYLSKEEKEFYREQADVFNTSHGFPKNDDEDEGVCVEIQEPTSVMIQFESKTSSHERNVPLIRGDEVENVGESLRMSIRLEADMRRDILSSFYAPSRSHPLNEIPMPWNKHFIVIHFGIYCQNLKGIYPAEFCVADFSIRDGLNVCYSRMLDPGEYPFGFLSDVKDSIDRAKYEMPGFDRDMPFDLECLDVIEALMHKHTSRDDEPGYLFTTRGNMDVTFKSLEYISIRAKREFKFKVYPLSLLIQLLLIEGEHLRSLNGFDNTGITITEAQALSVINDPALDYTPELSCNFHHLEEKEEGLECCSMTIVKKWIYNSLHILTKFYMCPKYLHNHVPELEIRYLTPHTTTNLQTAPNFRPDMVLEAHEKISTSQKPVTGSENKPSTSKTTPTTKPPTDKNKNPPHDKRGEKTTKQSVISYATWNFNPNPSLHPKVNKTGPPLQSKKVDLNEMIRMKPPIGSISWNIVGPSELLPNSKFRTVEDTNVLRTLPDIGFDRLSLNVSVTSRNPDGESPVPASPLPVLLLPREDKLKGAAAHVFQGVIESTVRQVLKYPEGRAKITQGGLGDKIPPPHHTHTAKCNNKNSGGGIRNPFLREQLEQTRKLLVEGPTPTQRFVETQKMFMDTDPDQVGLGRGRLKIVAAGLNARRAYERTNSGNQGSAEVIVSEK